MLVAPLAWGGVTLPRGTQVVWARTTRPVGAWLVDDVPVLGADLTVARAVQFAAGTRLDASGDGTYRGTLAAEQTVDGWPLAAGSEVVVTRTGDQVTLESGVLARDIEVGATRLFRTALFADARLAAGTEIELRDGRLTECQCAAECHFGALRAQGRVRLAPNGEVSLFLAREALVGGTTCAPALGEEARFSGAATVLRCAGASAVKDGVALDRMEFDESGAVRAGTLRGPTSLHGFTLPAGTAVEGWPLATAELDLPEGRELAVGAVTCASRMRFHPDGALAGCWFAHEAKLRGTWLRQAEFAPNGAITQATLARAQVVQGIGFPAGTRLEFDRAGRLRKVVLASATRAVVGAKRCGRYAVAPPHDDDTAIHFRPDGSVRSCPRGDDDGFEFDRRAEPDQYTIYEVILREFPTVHAIARHTVRSRCAAQGLAGLRPDTQASLAANDAAAFVLSHNIPDARPYALVDDRAELAFSAVGMNDARDQALVYSARGGGDARCWLLSGAGDRWVITASSPALDVPGF